MFRAAFFRSESPYDSNDTQAAQTGRSDRGAATFHVARPACTEARQSASGGIFAPKTFDVGPAAQAFAGVPNARDADPRRAAFPVP